MKKNLKDLIKNDPFADKQSRDYTSEKKENTYYDRPFVTSLIKEIQKVSPDIGAVFFDNQKMIVFFYRNIIIYKIILNKFNVDELSIEHHKKEVAKVLKMIELNMIQLKPLQEKVKGFNINKTGKIL